MGTNGEKDAPHFTAHPRFGESDSPVFMYVKAKNGIHVLRHIMSLEHQELCLVHRESAR